MKIACVCHTCSRRHVMDFDPQAGPGSGFSDWLTKHPGHDVDFLWPERSGKRAVAPEGWLGYLPNADVKVAYAASASVTITLASLAASSTLLAGRESTALDNGTNKYLDYLASGFYRTAATNLQAGRIRTAVIGGLDDTPAWPDVFDGTDSTETVSTADIYNSVCRIISEIVTDTSQRTYPWGPVSVAGFFGGICPQDFLFFVSHSAHTSTNAWSSTEGDHDIDVSGAYATVA